MLVWFVGGKNTAQVNTRCYPGSGPSWRGKTPTSCLDLYYTAWRSSQYKESLESSGCLTMATTQLDEEEESTRVQPFARTGSSSFYRRPGPLFPNILADRKSTRLNSSHSGESRMPSSACLESSGCLTMATTQLAEEEESTRVQPFARTGSSSFYRHPGQIGRASCRERVYVLV